MRAAGDWNFGKPVFRLRDRTTGIVSLVRSARRSPGVPRPSASISWSTIPISTRRRSPIPCGEGRQDELLRRRLYRDAGPDERRETALSWRARIGSSGPAPSLSTRTRPAIDNRALHAALYPTPRRRGARRPGGGAAKCLQDAGRHPLSSLPNVIVTPHVADHSEESIRLAREVASHEVARVLTGQLRRFPSTDELVPI